MLKLSHACIAIILPGPEAGRWPADCGSSAGIFKTGGSEGKTADEGVGGGRPANAAGSLRCVGSLIRQCAEPAKPEEIQQLKGLR
jgi:hypothetical protein